MNMQIFFHFISLTAGHKISLPSLKSPFSVSQHRKLHVSTSHLFMLNIGPDFHWAQRKCTLEQQWMWKQPATVRLCSYIILHRHSTIGTSLQPHNMKGYSDIWPPKSNQFTLESRWRVVLNLTKKRNNPQCNLRVLSSQALRSLWLWPLTSII